MNTLYSFKSLASPSHGQFPLTKFRCKLSPSCQVMFSISHSRYSVLASLALRACEARALRARKTYATLYREKKNRLFCSLEDTLVPEVFLDFSSRKRSRASCEAATTSRENDEEREKNLLLPWPRISLSCRRQLSNASNC